MRNCRPILTRGYDERFSRFGTSASEADGLELHITRGWHAREQDGEIHNLFGRSLGYTKFLENILSIPLSAPRQSRFSPLIALPRFLCHDSTNHFISLAIRPFNPRVHSLKLASEGINSKHTKIWNVSIVFLLISIELSLLTKGTNIKIATNYWARTKSMNEFILRERNNNYKMNVKSLVIGFSWTLSQQSKNVTEGSMGQWESQTIRRPGSLLNFLFLMR